MCRHGYETRWWRVPQHCPNLVPNRWDKKGGYKVIGEGEIAVRVRFATPYIGYEPEPDNKNRTFVNYTSMVDLWNTWYGQWYDMEIPRLMVRFEDLLFHAEETITKVCECGGGKMQKKFRYMEGKKQLLYDSALYSILFLIVLFSYLLLLQLQFTIFFRSSRQGHNRRA